MASGSNWGEGGTRLDQDQTQIMTSAHDMIVALDERVHCLEVVEGLEVGRRFLVGPLGVTVGRTPPSDIVLVDSEVSRTHCRVAMRGEDLVVSDLNSTNGAFVDSVRVVEPAVLPVGAIL